MQFFANAEASLALQPPLGVSFIFSHHASLPTLGEHAKEPKAEATSKSRRRERVFRDRVVRMVTETSCRPTDPASAASNDATEHTDPEKVSIRRYSERRNRALRRPTACRSESKLWGCCPPSHRPNLPGFGSAGMQPVRSGPEPLQILPRACIGQRQARSISKSESGECSSTCCDSLVHGSSQASTARGASPSCRRFASRSCTRPH